MMGSTLVSMVINLRGFIAQSDGSIVLTLMGGTAFACHLAHRGSRPHCREETACRGLGKLTLGLSILSPETLDLSSFDLSQRVFWNC